MLCDYCQKQKPAANTIDVERRPGLLATICSTCVGLVLNTAHDTLDQLKLVDGLNEDGYQWRPRERDDIKATIAKAKKLLT